MPAMLAYFLRHGSEEQAARVARFGREVFDAETAEEGIARFRAWLASLGLPPTLRALGVPAGDFDAAVDRCVAAKGGIVKGYMDFDRDAVEEIYRAAWE